MAPVHAQHLDHVFLTSGGAVGTLTLADGEPDAHEIKYEMILRASDEALLDTVYFEYPEYNEEKVITRSRVSITTPLGSGSSCVRYDTTMYIPTSLKKLDIVLHTTTHVQFAAGARVNAENLFVTLYSNEPNNMIVPSKDVTSQRQALEVYRGWIVGDASIVKETSITTQRGDGIANVKLHPAAPPNSDSNAPPTPAILRTTTGSGRSDFFYLGEKAFNKRPIDSTHISSKNADVYLTYSGSEFSGKIKLSSQSYTTTGAQKIIAPSRPIGDDVSTWTHYVGDINGNDRISVSSRGWTGLYF